MSRLQKFFEKNEDLSIRQFALKIDIPYIKFNTAKKEPVPGQLYDPNATNWAAMDKLVDDKKWELIDTIDWTKVKTTRKAKVAPDTTQFVVGDKWNLRRDGWVEIVYKNDSYIVFLPDGSEQPKSWAIDTWLINGPSKEERK